MNKEKITISEIVESMSPKNNFSKKQTEEFVKTLLSTIEDVLIEGEIIKIKDFGTFKPQWNEPRKSVDVNTGEEIIVPGYYKVVFAPDNVLKEQVNKPYSHLQPVEQSSDQKPSAPAEKDIENKTETQEEDTAESKTPQESPKSTHEPMRAFEEQAAQIKGLLSEIVGISGRKKQTATKENLPSTDYTEPAVFTPEEQKPEEIIEPKPVVLSQSNDEDNVKENGTTASNKADDSASDEFEADNLKTIAPEIEKELYEDRISRKQRKKIEREEQKQRRREEIKRYFDDNQFNVVREIHQDADNTAPSEAETIHYFDEEIFSIVGFEDTIQESAQAQAEQKDEVETTSQNNNQTEKSTEIAVEPLIDENEETEEMIDLHEETATSDEPAIEEKNDHQEIQPEASAKETKIPVENQDTEQKNEEAQSQESGNNSIVEIPLEKNDIKPDDIKAIEEESVEKNASSHELTSEPKTNPVNQTVSQEEAIDYTFTPVRKRRRRWWLFVLLPLILIAVAIGIWFYLPQIKPYIKPYIEKIIPHAQNNAVVPKTVAVPKKVIVDTTAVNPNDTANFDEVFNKERDYKEFIGSEVTTSAKDIKRIAKDRYGNDAFWIYIYEANNEVIEDPKNIPVGTPVNIPKLDPRLINVNNPECIKKAKKLADDYLKN